MARAKASELNKYWRSLQRHPGTPIAAWFLLLGFASGACKTPWYIGGALGAAVMSVFFIPVLVTAWSMRNDR